MVKTRDNGPKGRATAGAGRGKKMKVEIATPLRCKED